MMKQVVCVLVCLSFCGCITTKTVGDLTVTGVVLDAETSQPLEGAEVYLRYLAQSNFSDHSKDGTPVSTDSQGRFRVPPEKIRLWGGWGQLTGYIKEWPEVHYRKTGYKPDGKAFMRPSFGAYQDMRLLLVPE
mgnify:CR=1 FL=1